MHGNRCGAFCLYSLSASHNLVILCPGEAFAHDRAVQRPDTRLGAGQDFELMDAEDLTAPILPSERGGVLQHPELGRSARPDMQRAGPGGAGPEPGALSVRGWLGSDKFRNIPALFPRSGLRRLRNATGSA